MDRTDKLSRVIIGVIITLTLLTIGEVLAFGSRFSGTATPLVQLPWVQPTAQSLATLASLAVFLLCAGRYRILGGAWIFWTGLVFLIIAVVDVVYILTWPGLVGDRPLLGSGWNTASWLGWLWFLSPTPLLLAVNARQPERLSLPLSLAAYTIVAICAALIPLTFVVFDNYLPTFIVGEVSTSLTVNTVLVMVVLLAIAAGFAYRRYQREQDAVLGYLTLFLIAFAFGELHTNLGGGLYLAGWYSGRLLQVMAFVVLLVGLLLEYVDLYRRERNRTAELLGILKSSPDAVFVADEEGRVRLASRRALQLLGVASEREIPVDTAERSSMYEVRDREGRPLPAGRLPLTRVARGEVVEAEEVEFRDSRNGSSVWLLVSGDPLVDEVGRRIGGIVVGTDITERKAVEQQRERLLAAEQEARAEAERAVRIRNEFIAVAAHELKTPITSLRGFSQVIIKKVKNRGSVEQDQLVLALSRIDQQTRRLSALTEQLLNATRLDAGGLTFVPEETDVSSLVERAIASAREMYPERTIETRSRASLRTMLDPLRMEQVITNLLDNAVKFSPRETPVELEVARNDDQVLISVRDYGKGIEGAERERIFERYYQAHGERHYGGMGLGLYISREIVHEHGGTLTYEDPPQQGKGALFVIRLPLDGRIGRANGDGVRPSGQRS